MQSVKLLLLGDGSQRRDFLLKEVLLGLLFFHFPPHVLLLISSSESVSLRLKAE